MKKVKALIASIVAAAAIAVPASIATATPEPAIPAYCNSSHGKKVWNLAKYYEGIYFQLALLAHQANNTEAFKVYYGYYQYFASANLWFKTVCK